MARKAREKAQSGIYHVLIRGNANIDLFYDDEDTQFYIDLLNDLQQQGRCLVYAYALLPTHIHLLIQESVPNASGDSPLPDQPEPIGSVIRRLASSYSYFYNVKYDHYGPIYQDRFKSQPVETRPFFLRVLDFILAQPVEAKATLTHTLPSSPQLPPQLSSQLSQLPPQPEKILDYTPRPLRITESRLLTYLQQHHAFSGIGEFLQRPADEQNKIIADCKHQGGSVRQLARLTGIPYQRVFLAK